MKCAAVVTEGHPKCGHDATMLVLGPQVIAESFQAGVVMAPCCEGHVEAVFAWFLNDPVLVELGGEVMVVPVEAAGLVYEEFGADVWEVVPQAC